MPILQWLNKDKSIKEAGRVPYRLLKTDPKLSYGDENTENMLIQGDNLDALKALLPYYAGKVKCIFIDPPYNTKKDFGHYDDNLEHTRWLEMMFPRLELLREFLSEDGSIWVTIDDDEAHYLKVIMDEVFGRANFIANCVWQKKYAATNDSKYLSDVHDHIISFAKNKNSWKPNLLKRSDELNAKYSNSDNDPRGDWYPTNLSVKTFSEKNYYPIISPMGKEFFPPPTRAWVVSKEKYQELLSDNRIWFGKKGDGRPYKKTFLSEVQQGTVPITLWLHTEAGHNIEATPTASLMKLISQTTTISLFLIFVFDRWLWKILPEWILGIPKIYGTWKGKLEHSQLIESGAKQNGIVEPFFLCIRQNFCSLTVHALSEKSDSVSTITSLKKGATVWEIIYAYDNAPALQHQVIVETVNRI